MTIETSCVASYRCVYCSETKTYPTLEAFHAHRQSASHQKFVMAVYRYLHHDELYPNFCAVNTSTETVPECSNVMYLVDELESVREHVHTWTCDICNKTMKESKRETHLKTVTHENKRIRELKRHAAQKRKEYDSRPPKHKPHKGTPLPETWTCNICSVTVKYNAKERHELSNKHKHKLTEQAMSYVRDQPQHVQLMDTLNSIIINESIDRYCIPRSTRNPMSDRGKSYVDKCTPHPSTHDDLIHVLGEHDNHVRTLGIPSSSIDVYYCTREQQQLSIMSVPLKHVWSELDVFEIRDCLGMSSATMMFKSNNIQYGREVTSKFVLYRHDTNCSTQYLIIRFDTSGTSHAGVPVSVENGYSVVLEHQPAIYWIKLYLTEIEGLKHLSDNTSCLYVNSDPSTVLELDSSKPEPELEPELEPEPEPCEPEPELEPELEPEPCEPELEPEPKPAPCEPNVGHDNNLSTSEGLVIHKVIDQYDDLVGEQRYNQRVNHLKQIVNTYPDHGLDPLDDQYWVWYSMGNDKECSLSDIIDGLYNLPCSEYGLVPEVYIRDARMRPDPFPHVPIVKRADPVEYGLLMGANKRVILHVKGKPYVFGLYGRRMDPSTPYECWMVKFENGVITSLVQDKDIPTSVEIDYREFVERLHMYVFHTN